MKMKTPFILPPLPPCHTHTHTHTHTHVFKVLEEKQRDGVFALQEMEWIGQSDCVWTHISGPQRGSGKEEGPSERRELGEQGGESEWSPGEGKRTSSRGSLVIGVGPQAAGRQHFPSMWPKQSHLKPSCPLPAASIFPSAEWGEWG